MKSSEDVYRDGFRDGYTEARREADEANEHLLADYLALQAQVVNLLNASGILPAGYSLKLDRG